MNKKIQKLFAAGLVLLIFMLTSVSYSVVQRFPKPEFESGYTLPSPTTPSPRAEFYEYLDVFVLFLALAVVSYLALKKRSRRGVFWTMIFSLLYFGFWRKGCVCSIGSIQNVTLAFFDQTYVIPLTVVVFFALPLVFTLFYGRSFCAGVCPLGAMQDFVIVKPIKVPTWLGRTLSLIPYIYLSAAILFAATGSDFIICRYDPFIGFFRFGAGFGMIVFGLLILLLGVFVARPYCRFLCPYGVVLGWMSKLSRNHVTITPSECIQCRLCEDSCPFDAIDFPTPERVSENRQQSVKKLMIMIGLIPVFVFLGGWLVSNLNVHLSRVHNKVRLAERIELENNQKVSGTTLETRTFRASGTPTQELYDTALNIRNNFKVGGWILGGFLGLVFGLEFIRLTIRRKNTDYQPNRVNCLSCGRCFEYCPVERE